MISPRQYALAITRDGQLVGYVGSRPEWSALGIEQARKFATPADALAWFRGVSALDILSQTVVGVVGLIHIGD